MCLPFTMISLHLLSLVMGYYSEEDYHGDMRRLQSLHLIGRDKEGAIDLTVFGRLSAGFYVLPSVLEETKKS